MAKGNSRLGVMFGTLGSGGISDVARNAVAAGQQVFGASGGASSRLAGQVGGDQILYGTLKNLARELKNTTDVLKNVNKELAAFGKGLKGTGGAGGAGEGGGGGKGRSGEMGTMLSGALMGIGYNVSNMILGTITGFFTNAVSERWSSWRNRQNIQAIGGADWRPKVISPASLAGARAASFNPMGMTAMEPVLGVTTNPISSAMKDAAAFGYTRDEDVFPMLGAVSRAGLKSYNNIFPLATAAVTGASPEAAASLLMSGASAGLGGDANIRNMNRVTEMSRQFGGDRATSLFEEMVKQLKTLTDQGEKNLTGQAGFMGVLAGGPGIGFGLSPENAAMVASQTAGKFRGISMFSVLAQRQLGAGGNPMAFNEQAQLAMLPDENLRRMGRLEEIQAFRKKNKLGGEETATTNLSMAGIKGFLGLFPGIGKNKGQLQMAQSVMASQGLNLDVDTISRIAQGTDTKADAQKVAEGSKTIFNSIEKNTADSAKYLGALVDIYAQSITGEEGKKNLAEIFRKFGIDFAEGTVGAVGATSGSGGSWKGWEARENQYMGEFIAAGKKYGVDPAMLMSFSKQDSIGYNADIKNPTSSAAGLAQGMDKDWAAYMKATGNLRASKTNVHDATDFLGWLTAEKEKNVGTDPVSVMGALGGFGARGGIRRNELLAMKADLPRIRGKIESASAQPDRVSSGIDKLVAVSHKNLNLQAEWMQRDQINRWGSDPVETSMIGGDNQ